MQQAKAFQQGLGDPSWTGLPRPSHRSCPLLSACTCTLHQPHSYPTSTLLPGKPPTQSTSMTPRSFQLSPQNPVPASPTLCLHQQLQVMTSVSIRPLYPHYPRQASITDPARLPCIGVFISLSLARHQPFWEQACVYITSLSHRTWPV